MLLAKALKPTLACKFNFIFYFYLLKSCHFNFSDLLLLINNSVGIRHCNYQPCSHIYGKWCLLKLTNFVKAKLYEATFSLI